MLVLSSAGDALADGLGPAVSMALIDTGSSQSWWNEPMTAATPFVETRTIPLLAPRAAGDPAVRAEVQNFNAIGAPLTGLGGAPPVAAILGGDSLSGLSLAMSFASTTATLTMRDYTAPGLDFLSYWNYAVLNTPRMGGGQVTVSGKGDFLGESAPYNFPATRLVVRTCAGADAFYSTAPPPATCCNGQDYATATGTNLGLVLGTGYGRTILSRTS